jgi:hypothetical protein
MVRRLIRSFAVFCCLFPIAQGVGAQENEVLRNIIRLSYAPFGAYNYSVIDGDDFYGGFNELSVGYEYRFSGMFGVEGNLDFRGHKYEGYETSSNALVRFYGLPGLRFGVGAVFHPIQSAEWDVSIGMDLDLHIYVESEEDFFPGIGASGRVEAFWFPIPGIGIGAQVRGHISTHKGGPHASDPSISQFPFDIYEAGGGVVVRFDF